MSEPTLGALNPWVERARLLTRMRDVIGSIRKDVARFEDDPIHGMPRPMYDGLTKAISGINGALHDMKAIAFNEVLGD